MIRSKRLQNRITAGRFTLPAAILLSLFCWILTSILLPEVPVIKSNYRWIYSGMGKYTFKFHLLWRRRLLPDRTKQYFCHHPYAGIRTNGHLFPVYIRLSGPASSLCRGLCLDSISYISVLPVQGLPTFPSGRHYVLFVPLYRVG